MDVMTTQSFAILALHENLLANLLSLNFNSMTPVQAQSLPVILTGQDVIVQAKTGSGKTVSFGLAILNRLQVEKISIQAMILCPTRELADQIVQVLRQLARQMHNIRILNLSGGIPIRSQYDTLRHGAHIVVGTPGRIKKHLEEETLILDQLQVLVLDEADRMLDMGFCDDISDIFTYCPLRCQTLLFSATYPPGVKHLATKFMLDPCSITVEDSVEAHEDIEQIFYRVKESEEKSELIKALLLHHQPQLALIFCNLKEQTVQLSYQLRRMGFSALPLNGDMDQVERDQSILRFRNNSCSILVATDVAARGLDIQGLPLVINYELAANRHMHIHRVGRTGRAGARGLAVSLVGSEDENRLEYVEKSLQKSLFWGEIKSLNPRGRVFKPDMVTLYISAGRKDKIRPGDILGSLTKDAGLSGETIGRIDIGPLYSYVAIHESCVDQAFDHFDGGRLKGRKVRVRKLI